MSIALTQDAKVATPIVLVAKEKFEGWLKSAPDAERHWLKAVGFTGEDGKFAFVPGADGRASKVVAGASSTGEQIWALAVLPDALPEGTYRLTEEPDDERATAIALGWSLAAYAFTRYKAPKRAFAQLVWPAKADRAEVERIAHASIPRPRPDQHARRRHGPARAGVRRREASPKSTARRCTSSSATICSPRTIRRSTPSAAPARAPPRLHRHALGRRARAQE